MNDPAMTPHDSFPSDRTAKRAHLLQAVDGIGKTLRAAAEESETLSTLAPAAVTALRDAGMFRLKMPAVLGGAEADPVTEMLVLEELAYHDFTSAWCTMVGATSVASMGAFLPPSGIDKVFKDGRIPTGSISFFPAGSAVPTDGGYSLSGRWRFNSGIGHAEWAVGGAAVKRDDEDGGDGPPEVILCAIPIDVITRHHNWDQVVGLKGTGSIDFSVEDHFVADDLAFTWDMATPTPQRGGNSYLMPPICFAAKEHGAVAIGAARRALDEIRHIATSTRGTYRMSKLEERQVFQRYVGESDLKLRAARALLHEVYTSIETKIAEGWRPDAAAITEARSAALYATDVATEIASQAYHFAGNTALRQPHIIERIFRDIHTAGLHQVVSDTAYENQGRELMGIETNPMR